MLPTATGMIATAQSAQNAPTPATAATAATAATTATTATPVPITATAVSPTTPTAAATNPLHVIHHLHNTHNALGIHSGHPAHPAHFMHARHNSLTTPVIARAIPLEALPIKKFGNGDVFASLAAVSLALSGSATMAAAIPTAGAITIPLAERPQFSASPVSEFVHIHAVPLSPPPPPSSSQPSPPPSEPSNQLTQSAEIAPSAPLTVEEPTKPIVTNSLLYPTPTTFVIAFGSANIRYGTADMIQPKSKPMCIAYRCTTEPSKQQNPPPPQKQHGIKTIDIDDDTQMKDDDTADLVEDEQWKADTTRIRKESLEHLRTLRIVPPPKPKFFEDYEQIPIFSADNVTTSIRLPPHSAELTFTDVSASPSFVVGEQAINIHPHEPYKVIWPIRRGHFHAGFSSNYLNNNDNNNKETETIPWDSKSMSSFSTISSHIERILFEILTVDLQLPATDFPVHSVALALPDTFTAYEIYEIVRIFLEKFKVRDVFVHRNSVLSEISSGVPSGCVVNLGAQTTHIVCIEDGIIQHRSEISLEYGGDDLTVLLSQLVKLDDHYLPYPACKADPWYPSEFKQWNVAKEKVCVIRENAFEWQWIELKEYLDDYSAVLHRTNVSTAAVLTPLALFNPKLFECAFPPLAHSAIRQYYSSLSRIDPLTDTFIRQSYFYPLTTEYRLLDVKPKWPPPINLVVATEPKRRRQEEGSEGGKQRKQKSPAIPSASPVLENTNSSQEINNSNISSNSNNNNKPQRSASPYIPASPSLLPSPSPIIATISEASEISRNPSPATTVGATIASIPASQTSVSPIPVAAAVITDETSARMRRSNAYKDPSEGLRTSPTSWQTYLQSHLPLYEAILRSISYSNDTNIRFRMLANIVFAGGGCKMRNLVTKVYDLLHENIESFLPDCKDGYIKIIESPKAVEPADLPWRGAAIIGSTRNEISFQKDMWIPRDEFLKQGPKVLRNYLPFTI